METFKGEVFCPECGANMALGIDKDVVEVSPGKEFIKRTLYLYCPNQNCPSQFKRVALPQT